MSTAPAASDGARGGAGSVPAVGRAVALLDAIADADGAAVTVSELARRVGLPKSSTANLCAALVEEDLARRRDNGFVLGRRLAELGGRYLSGIDEIAEFYQLCRRSPTLSRETLRASVLDGLDVLYLARFDGNRPMRLTANIGDRFPASCTATGKALLASLDPAALADRLRGVPALPALTDHSITSPSALLSELDAVRGRGWASDEEETTPGVTCYAVGVADPGEPARFGISVTVLTSRVGRDLDRGVLLAELRAVAAGMASPLVPRPRPDAGAPAVTGAPPAVLTTPTAPGPVPAEPSPAPPPADQADAAPAPTRPPTARSRP